MGLVGIQADFERELCDLLWKETKLRCSALKLKYSEMNQVYPKLLKCNSQSKYDFQKHFHTCIKICEKTLLNFFSKV